MHQSSPSYSLLPPSLAVLLTMLAAGCNSSTPTSTSTNPPPPTPTAADITIVAGASLMTTGAFSPDVKTVALNGGTSVSVRWVNNDVNESPPYGGAVTHHIVSNDGTSFDTGLLGGNQSSTKMLTVAGTYPYHCAIHPGMVGTVVVNP
jgi:plastocyanin